MASVITFKFDLEDPIYWKNPHDRDNRPKVGVVVAQVRRSSWGAIFLEYHCIFNEVNPFLKIVCNEKDLSLKT